MKVFLIFVNHKIISPMRMQSLSTLEVIIYSFLFFSVPIMVTDIALEIEINVSKWENFLMVKFYAVFTGTLNNYFFY